MSSWWCNKCSRPVFRGPQWAPVLRYESTELHQIWVEHRAIISAAKFLWISEMLSARRLVSDISWYHLTETAVHCQVTQCFELERGELEFESASDRQPVHFLQNECHVFTPTYPCYQPGILYWLQSLIQFVGYAVQYRVAAVKTIRLERLRPTNLRFTTHFRLTQ